jgi:hypothetical protein
MLSGSLADTSVDTHPTRDTASISVILSQVVAENRLFKIMTPARDPNVVEFTKARMKSWWL